MEENSTLVEYLHDMLITCDVCKKEKLKSEAQVFWRHVLGEYQYYHVCVGCIGEHNTRHTRFCRVCGKRIAKRNYSNLFCSSVCKNTKRYKIRDTLDIGSQDVNELYEKVASLVQCKEFVSDEFFTSVAMAAQLQRKKVRRPTLW
jgi:hypothetical protein